MKKRILFHRTLYVLLVLALVLLSASSANTQAISPNDPNPILLIDLQPGEYGGDYASFTPINGNQLIFAAYDSQYGYEPWVTDGTQEGTHLLKDIFPGWDSSMMEDPFFVQFKNEAYFFASDGTSTGLWKTRGTAETTIKVLNMQASDLVPSSEQIFIFQSGARVSITDGTPGNSRLIGTMGMGKNGFRPAVEYQGRVYAFTYQEDRLQHRYLVELWSCGLNGCDTTPIKSWELPDTQPLFEWYYFSPRKAGNLFFFSAYSEASGFEIWQSDGTTNGTVMIQELVPGSESILQYSVAAADNGFYFIGTHDYPYEPLKLYFTTGKNTGGIREISANVFPSHLTAIGQHLYFLPVKERDTSAWMARTDGTPQGTQIFEPASGDYRAMSPVTELGNMVYFSAYGETMDDQELFIMPGQPSATRMFADIRPGEEGSHPDTLLTVNNRVIFLADDGIHGRELWSVNPFPHAVFLPLTKR